MPQIEMVLVPAGTFMMGSPDGVGRDDEHPRHQVTVQSFYMGKYEVTRAQYLAVMGPDLPKVKYSNMHLWEEAVEFCKRLSHLTGRKYRLPTEAEWEYACRVGQEQPNAFGLYDIHFLAWCEDVYHDSYNEAPSDGSAWVSGGESNVRVLRGGRTDGAGDVCSARTEGHINEFIVNIGGLRVVIDGPRVVPIVRQ